MRCRLSPNNKNLAASAMGLCALAAGEINRGDVWQATEYIMRAQVELQELLGFSPKAAPIYPRARAMACSCYPGVVNVKCRIHGDDIASAPVTVDKSDGEGRV